MRTVADVAHLRAMEPQDQAVPDPELVTALGLEYHRGEYVFSVVNRYLTGSAPVIRPEVGMPCTIVVGSDRYPGTVVAVSMSRHKIWVQRDKYDGEIRRDLHGEKQEFVRRKNGAYRGLRLGVAEYKQDPSF